MSYVHDAAMDWVRRALAEELRDTHAALIEGAAQILLAVAEDYEVPVEELIAWIHKPRPAKVTAADWVRHCVEYEELRTKLGLARPGADTLP
jgi:hypothetical protein